MKKKILVWIGVTAVLLAACYEEWGTGHPQDKFLTYEEEVADAREFYESLRPVKSRGVRSEVKTSADMIADMEPRWGKHFTYRRKNARYRTVESVMYGNRYYAFVQPEVYEKYLATKDYRYKRSMTRLVVQTDRESGERYAFTMTLMPDLDYIEKTDFKPFHNTYLHMDKAFSGVVLFHDLDGCFANGWRYREGRITHSISEVSLSQSEIDEWRDWEKRQASTRSDELVEVCDWVDYYDIIEECTVWCYGNDEFDYFECDDGEEECITYTEYRESKYECEWVPASDESGGGYIPPSDRDYPVPTRLERFFSKNEIGSDIEKLDQLYDAMLSDCAYEQMADCMSENEFKMSAVRYDETMNGDASVTNGAVLKLHDESYLRLSTIQHEFYHMYQYSYGGSDYLTNVENIVAREFERQVFVDMEMVQRTGGNFNETSVDPNHTWGYNNMPSDECEEYQDWIRKLTDNGTYFPDEIKEADFRKHLKVYARCNVAYGRNYPCNPDNFNPDCINSLLSLIESNCK